MKTKRAVTFVELIAATLALSLAVTVWSQTTKPAKLDNKLVKCLTNLKQSGMAMMIYAQDNREWFPMNIVWNKEHDGSMTLFDQSHREAAPTSKGTPSPTADLWTLIRVGHLPKADLFVCPLTKDKPDPAKDVTKVYDFAGAEHLSYGVAYMYDPDFRFQVPHLQFPADTVLMADGNPYLKGKVKDEPLKDRGSRKKGNSLNHGTARKHQMVLFVDGSIHRKESPDVGVPGKADPKLKGAGGKDNCYTQQDGEYVDPGTAPTDKKVNVAGQKDMCVVP